MTELQRYLAEEVAEDHVGRDHHPPRSDRSDSGCSASGATAASAMLAAEAGGASRRAPDTATATGTGRDGKETTWAPVADGGRSRSPARAAR